MQLNTTIELITEDTQYGYRLSGPFCAAERKNRNGRIYLKEDLKKETLRLKALIESGTELYLYQEHPDHINIVREDSCAVFESIEWNDEENYGSCVVKTFTDTESGKAVNEDLSKGIGYGISTRGLGSVNEQTKVVENYEMITADLIKDSIHGQPNQSCQICTMSTLHEAANSTETEINTMSDFLIESIESEDCGCSFHKLDEAEQKIVQNKIYESFCGIWNK